jgi:hypothetical protein
MASARTPPPPSPTPPTGPLLAPPRHQPRPVGSSHSHRRQAVDSSHRRWAAVKGYLTQEAIPIGVNDISKPQSARQVSSGRCAPGARLAGDRRSLALGACLGRRTWVLFAAASGGAAASVILHGEVGRSGSRGATSSDAVSGSQRLQALRRSKAEGARRSLNRQAAGRRQATVVSRCPVVAKIQISRAKTRTDRATTKATSRLESPWRPRHDEVGKDI